MKSNASGGMMKLIIIGLGAMLLYSNFGPVGLIALGVIMLMAS